MKGITNIKKILIPFLSVCIILGIFLVGYIYSWLKYISPHYHANFAMYIDGERVDFSGDEFMEDVAWCWLSELMFPKHRAHLHSNNQDTIHVHAEGVSWGHFFANNGVIFNDNIISLRDWEEILWVDENNKISFLLNGELIINPFNDLIKSKDQLIISYWSSQNIWDLFVSDNAGEYNSKYDPGTCSGWNEGSISALLSDLLHGLMWH